MFSLFRKSAQKEHRAEINGKAVQVFPRETILHAALRENIDFPHSCRVGGCASCKCRLVKGTVKELTDIGYILSDEELDQGYILACQSVPTSDVQIAVEMTAQKQRKAVPGRVILQERLTHDITHLKLQLDQTLNYKAGQYADLSLSSLPGLTRSYSFATACQIDATLSFFVRKEPGGQFSTEVNDRDMLGQTVMVNGPAGDFWLRPSEAPMIMVAGGSGLAPILAILQDALDGQNHRPVTLLFGARTQWDLYRLGEIRDLAHQWSTAFRFIPVLSREDENSDWSGARGRVTDIIPTLSMKGSDAYLCGPPGMVDAAEATLLEGGLERANIHADRFTTRKDDRQSTVAMGLAG